MDKTVILLGNSPFLLEVDSKIQYVLDRFYSIGINEIIEKYPTNEHVFQDMCMVDISNKYPNIKTVSLDYYGDLIQKENKELYNSFSFDFENNTYRDLIKENKLAWCGFTHDYALSYCVHKGWEKVVLIGTADFIKGYHYTSDKEFKYSQLLRENSIKFISQIIPKRINVVTCNPLSPLNIPYLDINDLLK